MADKRKECNILFKPINTKNFVGDTSNTEENKTT